MTKLLLTFIVLLLASSAFGSAANIYLGNSAVGNNNGTDCNDAYVWTWFNNAAIWGTGSGQIGPGTAVHVCGSIGASAPINSFGLIAQGSGTSAQDSSQLFVMTRPELPDLPAVTGTLGRINLPPVRSPHCKT